MESEAEMVAEIGFVHRDKNGKIKTVGNIVPRDGWTAEELSKALIDAGYIVEIEESK